MKKEIIDIKTLNKVNVRQLDNKNQFVINYNNCNDPCYSCVSFQSYATLICIWQQQTQLLYVNWSMWDYSKTTLKHLKKFINEYTPFTYENKQQFTQFLLSSDKIKLFNER